MNFDLEMSLEILERTPGVMDKMLRGLPAEWTKNNEGGESWSPYDIIGHFIHGEKTDWIPRMDIILSDRADKSFTPFDRFAQFSNSKGKTLEQLLDDFSELRQKNLEYLRARKLSAKELEKTGVHPAFGDITLSQLLAAWTAHDLNHIAQATRVMSKQYKEAAGPWVAYIKTLQ